MNLWNKGKWGLFFKTMIWLVLVAFTSETLGLHSISWAQDYTQSLPAPGTRVALSSSHAPVMMKGIKTYAENPFRFDFFIDPGNGKFAGHDIEKESEKLIKYFLASLTVPENDMWVNLSPEEKNRITPQAFGVTEMGRDLLAQDYLLKQVSASLLDPSTKEGEAFWKKVYAQVHQNVDNMSTLNKVWIVPQTAEVYTKDDSAFVVSSHLKVMLEEDYNALHRSAVSPAQVTNNPNTALIREVIIPAIEKDVNEGENFELLRQIYQSMILATWFKRHLRETVFGRVYIGQNKVAGVDIDDKNMREKIYEQYLTAFKKGVFDFIKEDYDESSDQMIPRKYFAGGIAFTNFASLGQEGVYRETTRAADWQRLMLGSVNFMGQPFYRVSSVVVNPEGVSWYNSMRAALSQNSTGVQSAASPVQSTSVATAMNRSLKKFFTQDGLTRKILGALLTVGVLFSVAGYAPDAQGAKIDYDGHQGMIIQVEKGDTLGDITLQLMKQKSEMKAAGLSQELPAKLWGANGAVNVVAKAMGLSDVNQTIYPKDTFVLPSGLLSQDAQVAVTGGVATTVTPTGESQVAGLSANLSMPASHQTRDVMPVMSQIERKPRQISYLRDDSGSIDEMRHRGREFSDDSFEGGYSAPPHVNPLVPITIGTLLFTGLGWMARQSLLQRSATPPSVVPSPNPAHPASGSGEQRVVQAIEKPVLPKQEVVLKTRAAELLANQIRTLSLPYINNRNQIKSRLLKTAQALVDDFGSFLRQSATWSEEDAVTGQSSLKEQIMGALQGAWESFYNQEQVDDFINTKANELAETWETAGQPGFENYSELDDFINVELNALIQEKVSTAERYLDQMLDEQHKALLLAAMNAARQWELQSSGQSPSVGNMVKATTKAILEDANRIWGIPVLASMNDRVAKSTPVPVTPQSIVLNINEQSLELKTLAAQFHREAQSYAAELGSIVVQTMVSRLGITTAESQSAVERYFQPVLARYFDTALFNEYDANKIADVVSLKTSELAQRFSGQDTSSSEFQSALDVFIKGDLRSVILQEMSRVVGTVHQSLFAEKYQQVYDAAIVSAIEMERTISAGEPIVLTTIVGAVTKAITSVLQEQSQLSALPVFASGLAMELAQQSVEPTALTQPVANEESSATLSRAPSQSVAALDGAVLLTTATIMLATGHYDSAGMLGTLLSPFAFRAGMSASYWLHEFSHVLAGGRKAWSKANLLGNVSSREWLAMLLPFTGKIPTDLKVKVPGSRGLASWVNRATGLMTSTVVALAAVFGLRYLLQNGYDTGTIAALPIFLGSVAVWLASLKSDLIQPLRGKACEDEFNCGVAIVVSKRQADDKGLAGQRVQKIFKAMGQVTDIRGQQAAGVKTQATDKKGKISWVGLRLVNSKRGDLPTSLDQRFAYKTSAKFALGYTGGNDIIMFGHYRYGTSSAPQTKETHPHQWLPDRKVQYWALRDGLLENQEKVLGITIVHNGDFDDWSMNGQYKANAEIGHWLSYVLHQDDVTDGDSPKIAGMMDYLITKGMWDASVRYAYYETIAPNFEDVFNGKYEKIVTNQAEVDKDRTVAPRYKVVSLNTALTNEQMTQFAQRFTEVFAREGAKLIKGADEDLRDFLPQEDAADYQERMNSLAALEKTMLENLSGLEMVQAWDLERRKNFVHIAVTAFLQNDEYQAAKIFMGRALGSFGLGIATTLKTDGVILVADGQPLAIGMDEKRQNLLIASEPSALKISIDTDKTLDYRLTLRQNPGKGEIVNITKGNQLAIYSREKNRELTESEITDRLVALHRNPYISTLPELGRDDPIGDDIKDTALVMAQIKRSWEDPQSENQQTKANIMKQLLQKNIVNQIKRLSEDYVGVDAALHQESQNMVFAFGKDLVAELNRSVETRLSWMEDFDLRVALAGFGHMLEGALSLVFDYEYIDQMIRQEAAMLSIEMQEGRMSEKEVRLRINDFLQTKLKTAIAAEKARAYAEVQKLIERWENVITAELIYQIRWAALSGVEQQLKQASHDAFEKMESKWRQLGIEPGIPSRKKGLDLVVTGVEISQWMGEQFGEDLANLFPELKVAAVSANKILEDPATGGIDDQTIVLAISQSGQTFPTLNATIMLETLSPGRVFVLTGEWDTLMGQAVGQEFKPDSPFGGHIISNYSGFRPAEAVSLTGTATHATLTELLLNLGHDFRRIYPSGKPLGMTLAANSFDELDSMRDNLISEVERITGTNRGGQPVESTERKSLDTQAKKWARHVLDAPLSKVLSSAHLILAVVGGFLLMPFLAGVFGLAGGWLALGVVVLQYFFFEFFQYSTVIAMRMVQKRTVFARAGKRTIVIGDRSYIHQSLEMFLTKMNSLSKSATAIDVHGANPNDHMLHRFGHRVVRGTLVLLGVPDGRLGGKLAQWQSSVGMTGKQAKGVRNYGVGAEVITIGRERNFNRNASDVDITIKGPKATENQELAMWYENRFDSLSRLVSGQVLFHSMQRHIATFGLPPSGRWLWPWSWKIHRTQSGPRIATTAAPVSAANLGRFIKKPAEALPLGLQRRPGVDVIGQLDAALNETTNTSSSAINDVGGINLNPNQMQLRETGDRRLPMGSLPVFDLDPNMINTMPQDRFVPMILEIVPIKNVEMFLGMADTSPQIAVVK